MNASTETLTTSSTTSLDGTVIAFHSLGRGPGMVIVGGVLSDGSDYLRLADALAGQYTVHVMERRGRPGSGPQRPAHSIEDECADLTAVATATGSRVAFGHSFGGLVVLETARRAGAFDELFLYEPGVPLRGQLTPRWLDGYGKLLDRGDRRGAFALMVQGAGFAPRLLAVMPLGFLRLALRLGIRGSAWNHMDHLLEANLVEHRVQAALDAPDVDRFASISARAVLMVGAKSPSSVGGSLGAELANAIPDATVETLPGLGHLAPVEHPQRVASLLLERSQRPT